MSSPRIRVLVVDDSAFARKVIREVIQAGDDLEVVGIARDGLDALEKILELKPDVVTLDLIMPELDGLGVLRALALQPSSPRVVLVTMTDEHSDLGIAALRAGAIDVVHKPTAIATDRLYELGDELRAKIRAASAAHPRMPSGEDRPPKQPPLPTIVHAGYDVVVIGASTGGPNAISRILSSLPANFPVPIAIAIHMPTGYTAALATRLDGECDLHVKEASEGLIFAAGDAVIAPAGMHLRVQPVVGTDPRCKATLDFLPFEPHRPSIDVLFASAAESYGARVLGVVLTGMGKDGLVGCGAIKKRGGGVLTEAESTCVVYGMPRAVKEAGLSDRQVPIDRVGAALVDAVTAAR